ncbi:hypothetical protein B0H10DRAFT_511796 [Mycena sp. CBHHK59/15]|nr:hypothetical protein B0H10DRAFT_511796 [Mycena sp. CBHHK59/15]
MLWDEGYEHDFTRGKRHVQRACDVCRRRKSRCDGSQKPGNKCSTCIDGKLDCTYLTKRTTKRYTSTSFSPQPCAYARIPSILDSVFAAHTTTG